MEAIPGLVRCRQCDAVLGAQPWSMCLLCAGAFCASPLVEQKGVVTCGDCLRERLAREAASAVTESDELRVVALLLAGLIHRNHPLWFSGGSWRCEQTGQVFARLGGL